MKSYTDLKQSKKLVEILPIESADMCINSTNSYMITHELRPYGGFDNEHDPCWSLAALLELLDDEITDEEGNDYNLTILKESREYQLYYHDSWGRAEDIETDYHDNMVDACVEMIVKLHELKMLCL